MTRPAGLALCFADEGLRLGLYRGLVCSVWTEAPTNIRIAEVMKATRKVLTEPDPIGGLALVLSTKLPGLGFDAELRSQFVDVHRRITNRRGASVMAVEGEGFLAAGARSVLTGILLLARPSFPTKVCASRREAAQWLVPFLKPSPRAVPTAQDLELVLDSLAS